MTPDLSYLAWTSLLCLLLWVPHIAGSTVKRGLLSAEDYRSLPDLDVSDWIRRAHRAHLNLVENLAPFAALVLVAHVSGIANEATATAAAVFFWARVAHAVVFMAGIPYLRTLVFTVGTLAQLVIFWQIVGAG